MKILQNKKLLFLLLLICYGIISKAESNPITLVVWSKTGTKVAYALEKKPKITFTDSTLVITTNGIDVSYPIENLLRFTYEEDSETSIIDLNTEKNSIKFNGNSLLFPSLEANTTVSLYTINGKLVLRKTVHKTGKYSYQISNLDKGVYVVSVNELTYKIVKK